MTVQTTAALTLERRETVGRPSPYAKHAMEVRSKAEMTRRSGGRKELWREATD